MHAVSHLSGLLMNHQRARNFVLILFLAASFGFAAIPTSSAFSQTPDRPKLTIGNINFMPVSDGFYNTNIGLHLRRPNSPQINFNINAQHVKTVQEVFDQLRPAIDHLADELKNAEIEKPQ